MPIMTEMADTSLRNPIILIENQGFGQSYLSIEINYIYIYMYMETLSKFILYFSIFMKVEAHLGTNYGRNGKFEFEKSYYFS